MALCVLCSVLGHLHSLYESGCSIVSVSLCAINVIKSDILMVALPWQLPAVRF